MFAELETLLNQSPSRRAFYEILDFLDECVEHPRINAAIDYASRRLKSWPDNARKYVGRDFASLTGLRLVRELIVINPIPCPTTIGLQISKLGNLTCLSLTYFDLSLDQVRDISTLTGLKRLRLEATGLEDEACTHLSQLKSLTSLNLSYNNLTSVGVRSLATLKKLINLSLAKNQRINDRGMKYVSELRNLATLSVTGCEVSDLGVEHLVHLSKLEALWVDHCQVTSASPFLAMSNLKELDVANNNGFSMREVEKLEQIPGINLTY